MRDANVSLGYGDTLEVDPTDWQNFMLKRIGEREQVFAASLAKERARAKKSAIQKRWARAIGIGVGAGVGKLKSYLANRRDPDIDLNRDFDQRYADW